LLNYPANCERCNKPFASYTLHRIFNLDKREDSYICELCWQEWTTIFQDKLYHHPNYPHIHHEFNEEYIKFLEEGQKQVTMEKVC